VFWIKVCRSTQSIQFTSNTDLRLVLRSVSQRVRFITYMFNNQQPSSENARGLPKNWQRFSGDCRNFIFLIITEQRFVPSEFISLCVC
jgi:hypothetical protein